MKKILKKFAVKLFTNVFCVLKWIYCVLVTLPRDLRGLCTLLLIKRQLKLCEQEELTINKAFEKLVKKHPNKICFIYEDEKWTFKDVESYACKVANVFSTRFKLEKGDIVSLFMENRVEFVCIWLGLAKLGVVTALINTNLKLKSLVYSIEVANSKLLIYGSELEECVIQADLKIPLICQGGSSHASKGLKLEKLLEQVNDTFVPLCKIIQTDILMYIYTSGTTGLPKPAVIKHNRYFGGTVTFYIAAGVRQNDVVYVTLPIYHSNGGLIGVGMALASGVTVVLKRKFSATSFWIDCIRHKCTVMMYVGEVCRYLVNQPVSHLDFSHQIRVAIGNGLRENVWCEFLRRFGRIRVVELYGSSEGNCTLANIVGKVGACGYVPLINRFYQFLPLNIIKIDSNMQPVRDKSGLCVRANANEVGLLVGIIENDNPISYFSGYANSSEASKKKIIENIFAFGQRAFNSGDLMQTDEYGWMYFSDRLGDTYRWKGENVSTIEVENILSSKLNSKEVVVYGVSVPGAEGKAGMACISVNSIDDLKELSESVKRDLAAYARPLFLRLSEQIDHTGSFKAQKSRLVEDAYDRTRINDKLYYFDLKEQFYKELTQDIYEKIQLQLIKF